MAQPVPDRGAAGFDQMFHALLDNVERVIIGGGMAGAWDLFIGPLRAEVARRAFDVPAKRCEIVPGILGDDAGMVGNAGLVFKG